MIFMTNQFADILGDAAADRLPRDAVLRDLLAHVAALPDAADADRVVPRRDAGARAAESRRRDGRAVRVRRRAWRGCSCRSARSRCCSLSGLTWLALFLTPAASSRIEEIKFQRRAGRSQLGVLEAGKFTSPDSGETVLYAREVVGDELRDVFLQRQQGDRVVVILAERGERVVDPATRRACRSCCTTGAATRACRASSEFLVLEFDGARHSDSAATTTKSSSRSRRRSRRSTLLRSSRARRPRRARNGASRCRSRCSCSRCSPCRSANRRRARAATGGSASGCSATSIYANLLVDRACPGRARRRAATWLGMWWVHAAVARCSRCCCWLRQSGVARAQPDGRKRGAGMTLLRGYIMFVAVSRRR